jgi:Zn-dependent protease with chaperone function/tetratricopeptide (TPR) repeat protein
MVAEAQGSASAGVRPAADRVLSPPERTRLMVTAAGAVLLFYLLALASLALLGLYLLAGAVVALGAARFGLSGRVIAGLRVPEELVRVISRSLFLPRGRDASIEVSAEEAPLLFALVDSVAARAGVTAPDRTVLEMGCNAAVQLGGYLTGKGRTTLYLGLDFVAGLSERQLEAIIAHEMAHARLVQRGFNVWLRKAIIRAWRLAGAVEAFGQALRAHDSDPMSVSIVRAWSGPLAQTCGRLESAYSRQDEFAADGLAAQICGTAICREALTGTETLAARSAAISWHERLVQARRSASFAGWLRQRLLAPVPEAPLAAQEPTEETSGEYDSHPPLAARIAALPESSAAGAGTDAPALRLLRDPDRLTDRLIEALSEVAAAEEAEQTREWAKAVRENLPTSSRQQQLVGGSVLLFFGFIFFAADSSAEIRIVALLFLAGGAALHAFAWLRRPTPLPVPSLYHWEEALRRREARRTAELFGKKVDPPAAPAVPDVKGRGALGRYWSEAAYDALLRCEYEAALSAAEHCLNAAPRSQDGLLAHGIASAFLRASESWSAGLEGALRANGLTGPVPAALAWGLSLASDLQGAEGYAAVAARQAPRDASRWLCLAWIQWQQDRNYVALRSARRAVEAAPDQTDPRLLLVRILLDVVRPREALEQIEALEKLSGGWARTDFETMLQRFRALLLLGRFEEASHAAARLREVHPKPTTRVALGNAYWGAWLHDEARDAYRAALDAGFFPQALLNLGALAREAGDMEEARRLLFTALDLSRETPEDATGTIPLLSRICEELLATREIQPGCTGWDVRLDLRPLPLTCGFRLLVAAPGAQAAREHAAAFYAGLNPAGDPDKGIVSCELLRSDQFPHGPARPGVCTVVLE